MEGNILIVEDGRFLRVAEKQILTHAGFSVTEASDGEEALRQARQNQPDLIILDLLLPRLGGERVLQALRQEPATATIPVIVMSSLPQCNAEKLKEGGALAYVEKSKLDLTNGSENILIRLVRAALRKSRGYASSEV